MPADDAETEQQTRAETVLDILSRNLTLIRDFLDGNVKFCGHQPLWPRGPLTSPAQVLATREAVSAFAAQLTAPYEDGGCTCHHGMPEQHHGWAARAWLDLSGHAIDYARGRSWAPREQLTRDEEYIRQHIGHWSFPPRRT